MARNDRGGDVFDTFVNSLVDEIASRLRARVGEIGAGMNGGARGRPAGRRGGPKGIKRDMRCRYPGCKNRSKGPRFRFLCEEHLKLPKKEQDAILAKARA